MRLPSIILSLFFVVQLGIAQNSVTIGWDVSSSMQDRALDKELNFLSSYFKKYPDIEVNLLQFNNLQTNVRNYTVSNGDWTAIKEALSTARYDGATSYQILGQQTYRGGLLLFTDGMENLERDAATINASPLYVINGNYDHDLDNLKFLALSNKGRYIGLDVKEPPSDNKDLITYQGNVVSEVDGQPIKISIKDSDRSVNLTESGSYQIQAEPGDVLVFSSPGLDPVEKELGDNNTLNVYLKGDGIQLDAVYLENENRRDPNQKNIVGGDIVNKDAQGYAVQSIGEDDINVGQTNISGAVQGKFSGVTTGINQDISQSIIRGQMSIFQNNYPLVIIDGAPVARSYSGRGSGIGLQLADFIDVNNVAEVTVLKGFAATNKYGSEGSNGVVLIKTKMAADREKAGLEPGVILGNTATYTGETLSGEVPYSTPYLDAMSQAPNQSAAYSTYYEQRDSYQGQASYLGDLYSFFLNKNPILAQQIAYNAIEREERSATELRGLLLKSKHPQLSLDLANALLDSYPAQIQAYYEVALANKAVGNYQLALDILIGIENGTINPSLDFGPLEAAADHEIRALVREHKSSLNTSKLQVKHLQKNPLDARIVFEWNNPDGRFELQFVNPKKRYFDWEHNDNNEIRLKNEKLQGYFREEFEVVGGDLGEWIVNVRYDGNEDRNDLTPTLLRCTVYHDFGSDNQRKEERVIVLHQRGQENEAVRLNTLN